MWTQPRGAALGLNRISRSTRAQAAGDPSDGGWRKNPSATPRSPNKKAGKLAPREAVPPRWSSLDTGVTYGDRLTRMTRRQIRVGRHARRSYQNWVRTRVSPPEVASRETAADDRASPTVAREPPGVRNNVVAPSSPLAPYWTDRSFPPAIESETGTSEAEEDATLVNEFRDAAGAPFTVELSNEDAPPGLTKIELRGMDRANLLGALCSALARLDIAVVSGTISTGPDGRVRNTMHVRREGGAVDEDDFSRVSLQVLAACWNSDRRDWLRTRRPAGKYLTAAAPSPANTTRLQRELALAEARTRAVSARLADAAARLSADAWSPSDVDESLIREMEDAVRQVTEARARVAAGPRAIEGYPSTIDTLDERSDAASPFSAALARMGRIGGDADESSRATNPLEAALSRASPFVRGVAYMNLASLLFGTNQVVIKQVADAGVDDFTQMFLRFGLAAVPLLPHIVEGASRKGRGEMLKGAAHLGTILAVGYFLQIVGLEETTSAKGALTSTFTVLSVPIFAGLHGQRVPWYTWPASALGMVGVGLLTGGDGAAPTTGRRRVHPLRGHLRVPHPAEQRVRAAFRGRRAPVHLVSNRRRRGGGGAMETRGDCVSRRRGWDARARRARRHPGDGGVASLASSRVHGFRHHVVHALDRVFGAAERLGEHVRAHLHRRAVVGGDVRVDHHGGSVGTRGVDRRGAHRGRIRGVAAPLLPRARGRGRRGCRRDARRADDGELQQVLTDAGGGLKTSRGREATRRDALPRGSSHYHHVVEG